MTPRSDPLRRRCVSAAAVLPPRLLKQVQKYCQGLVWVPGVARVRRKTADYPERDREIRKEHATGVGAALLSKRYGLSKERIRQILQADCGAKRTDS